MTRILGPRHIRRAMQVCDQVQGARNRGGVANAACEEGPQTQRAGEVGIETVPVMQTHFQCT